MMESMKNGFFDTDDTEKPENDSSDKTNNN